MKSYETINKLAKRFEIRLKKNAEENNPVKFSGILVAALSAPEIDIEEDFVKVDKSHITLLSYELSKDARKVMKTDFNSTNCTPFPTITFGDPYKADNGTKCSIVVDCNEQESIRKWIEDNIINVINADISIDPSRIYHISVANRTGSQFDSVPDPWNHRV